LFVSINGWTPTYFFWRRTLRFHCLEHSSFHSYRVFFFLVLRLAFIFRLYFCS
jgi:hypothetical protein